MLDGKYKFNEIEPKMQELWEKETVFQYEKGSIKPTYSVDTPPPTISGALHIGHVASYTQAEAICRFKKLSGYNVFYPLGFDNNGLPTERLVEKTLGIRATDVSREEFITLCQKSIEQGVQNYKSLFQKLAFSVDWNLSYQTIDEKSRRISQRSFIELAKAGHAYRKQTPVQWCTDCKTSIAQAEIEATELPTEFHTIEFMVGNEPLYIATTRPEFLGGCVAVMVNPDDERYARFIGKKATVPIFNNEVRIIADEKAFKDKGTGAVMCCTYGDETDVEWCNTYELPYVKVITEDGKIDEHIAYLGGQKILQARQTIIELLKEHNLYIEKKEISHMVAVHDRCNTPVELLPSKQWFIQIMNIKQEIMNLANQVEWHPENMKKRLEIWVENLDRDWLISRQRYFGVPFPVWYCKTCGEPVFARDEDLPVNPLMQQPNCACPNCGNLEFDGERDVMDTWATSSVSELINASWGESDQNDDLIPMSVRSQAREIIRTWAFYTLVKSYYHTKQVPWKNLMINGWVMFNKKEKISKSKHNLKAPEELIKEYSADAIRYWATSTKLGNDMIFDEGELLIGARFITKLWNASKFSIMQLNEYDGKSAPKELLPIDKWLLSKWQKTKQDAIAFLEQYEIGLARQTLDKFFWDDYCDNYLEIAKERLYQKEKHGLDSALSGQYAIFEVLFGMLQLYNIFVPHITEYIYQEYYKSYKNLASISLSQIAVSEYEETPILFGEQIKEVVGEVRKLKAQLGISMKEPITSITITAKAEELKKFEKTKLDIIACTAAETVIIKEGETFTVQVLK